jgi:hypothetical protein
MRTGDWQAGIFENSRKAGIMENGMQAVIYMENGRQACRQAWRRMEGRKIENGTRYSSRLDGWCRMEDRQTWQGMAGRQAWCRMEDRQAWWRMAGRYTVIENGRQA